MVERKSPFYVTSRIAVIDLTTPICPMPLPCRARVSFSCHLARAEGWSGCHSGFGPPVQIRSWKWWFLKTRIKFIFIVLKKYNETDNLLPDLLLKTCHYKRKLLLYWRGGQNPREGLHIRLSDRAFRRTNPLTDMEPISQIFTLFSKAIISFCNGKFSE